VLIAAIAGCAGDTADVAPLGDYTTWKRIDTYGETPGHGDSYRIIYANDVATRYDSTRSAAYDDGTALVKEVYDRIDDPDPRPGALRVIEIARRIGPSSGDQAGWVFTAMSSPEGEETEKTFCWRRCHQASPFEGAWLDYSK